MEISCYILDDERGPRERLSVLLSKITGIKIYGIQGNPEIATEEICNKLPDIVFIDVEMPRMSGFDVIEKVRETVPGQCFIFITGYNQYAIKAIKSEAFDYLIKPIDIDELKGAINRFRSKLKRNRQPKKINPSLFELLSEREKEIVKYICEFKTAKEIAEILFISKHTVDTHRKNILKKLNIKTTTELILLYRLE